MANKLPWPQNLLVDIFGEDCPKERVDVFNPTQDNLYGLDYALSHIDSNNNPMFEACVRLHYQEGKTYAEIGRELNISGAAVGARMLKALKRLRHPTRTVLIVKGSEYVDERVAEEQQKQRSKTPWQV